VAKIEVMGKVGGGRRRRRRREGERRRMTSKGGEDVDEIRINQQKRLRYQLRGNQTEGNMGKRYNSGHLGLCPIRKTRS
jgi:hypothetical protein